MQQIAQPACPAPSPDVRPLQMCAISRCVPFPDVRPLKMCALSRCAPPCRDRSRCSSHINTTGRGRTPAQRLLSLPGQFCPSRFSPAPQSNGNASENQETNNEKAVYQRRNATALQEFHAQDSGGSLAALPKKPEQERDQKRGKTKDCSLAGVSDQAHSPALPRAAFVPQRR